VDDLPKELHAALSELELHYRDLESHPGGANGYVIFAKNRISNAEVAVKFYYGAPGDRRHDEPKLLASIHCPNVLRIIDARNLSDEWAFFITPRCEDGDLEGFIASKPTVIQAIDMALGVANGLSAIHANGLIHRDIKPPNVVCDGGRPLIADFGSVRQLAHGEADIPASGHSALYRPPESFQTGRYGIRGDIYQMGIVTYQLLGGHLPYDPLAYFSGADRKEYEGIYDDFDRSKFQDGVIYRRAASGKLMDLDSLPPWVGSATRKALRQMTHPDVAKRISNIVDVAAILTKIRSNSSDWGWAGETARLKTAGRTIELRPINGGKYEPFQTKGGNFRRIPSMPDASLKELVSAICPGT
jgi:eukaryotic-like serine/threonine-protein kinase